MGTVMVFMQARARLIRTAIADEQCAGRSAIRELLASERDVEIVGEYHNAHSAAAGLGARRPDLLFLDAGIRRESGLTLLAGITRFKPATIFVAEHADHALQAFDLDAIDCLLKPFEGERFRRSVERARRHIAGGPAAAATTPSRLAVKSRGKIHIIQLNDIDWLETAGNYVRIHVAGTAHLYRDSLRNFEPRLDAARFVRIHRSVIVNIDRVTHLEPSFRGEHVVTLQDRTRLAMTPPYRERMEAIVGRF
jgi:two-component system LytT family response regulator